MLRRGSCQPTVQAQRETPGARLAVARSFGKEGIPETVVPKNQSGEGGRDGWDQPFPCEFLYEPIQEARVYSLRWWLRRRAASPQLSAERRAPRLGRLCSGAEAIGKRRRLRVRCSM